MASSVLQDLFEDIHEFEETKKMLQAAVHINCVLLKKLGGTVKVSIEEAMLARNCEIVTVDSDGISLILVEPQGGVR